jgi:hypothetical protein
MMVMEVWLLQQHAFHLLLLLSREQGGAGGMLEDFADAFVGLG